MTEAEKWIELFKLMAIEQSKRNKERDMGYGKKKGGGGKGKGGK